MLTCWGSKSGRAKWVIAKGSPRTDGESGFKDEGCVFVVFNTVDEQNPAPPKNPVMMIPLQIPTKMVSTRCEMDFVHSINIYWLLIWVALRIG